MRAPDTPACSAKADTNEDLVIAADGLYKRDVFSAFGLLEPSSSLSLMRGAGFPDPFAVATVDGEQTQTTNVIKKTLNPYWNESFDL